jgi:hypothetical protein
MRPDEEQELIDHIRRTFPWSLACLLVMVLLLAVTLAIAVHWIEVSRWGRVLLAGIAVATLLVDRTLGGGSRPRRPR